MGYDDIGLYRPGKICGCLCVEGVVLKGNTIRDVIPGAPARAQRPSR